MTEPSNRYCERLRISPPTVEAAAAQPGVNLFLLMVVALLEILFDPAHEEFDELRRWVGPDFQPERFDLRAVNDRGFTVAG